MRRPNGRAVRGCGHVTIPPIQRGTPPACNGFGSQYTSWNETVGVSSAAGVSRHSTLHAASVSLNSSPRRAKSMTFGVVFLALPSGPDTEVEATARQHIEGRGLLGEQHGGT